MYGGELVPTSGKKSWSHTRDLELGPGIELPQVIDKIWVSCVSSPRAVSFRNLIAGPCSLGQNFWTELDIFWNDRSLYWTAYLT